MRLLGWIHNKLRQTHIDSFKDFTAGKNCTCFPVQPPHEDHVYHTRPSLDGRYKSNSSKPLKEEYEGTFSENEDKGVDENYEDEMPAVITEFFHCFLTIGTFGSEPITSDPATPTFPIYLENIPEGKTEVTENDLKLINYELEKFLEEEAEEKGYNESLARSSYVSTITPSDAHMEGPNDYSEDNGKTVVCPLQGYLFGSSIELPETGIELNEEKASLREMFHRKKVIDGVSAGNEGNGKAQAKRGHNSAKNLVKKILKMFHASSENSTPSSGDYAAKSVPIQKKLNKVFKIFHRKVNPVNSIAEKEFTKSHKEKTKKTLHDSAYDTHPEHQDENEGKFYLGAKSMEGLPCYENNLKLLQYGLSGRNLSRSREHWIKTDADYLVLEL